MSSNSKIQIEQIIILSENFSKGVVKANWVPGRLNVASNPVEVIHSSFYRHGILSTGERLLDIVDKLVEDNSYLTCTNGKIEYTPK